eukprot:jgi/Mesvir1/17580/Mv08815-RA.1
MLTHRSEEANLEQVMAIQGLGTQVMALLPVPDRTCRTFLAAADETLKNVTELFGEDVAGGACLPGMSGLSWLLNKCPNLHTLCVASRSDHDEPWHLRDHRALSWPCAKHNRIGTGLLSLEVIAFRCRGIKYLNVAACKDVTDDGLSEVVQSCRCLEALDVSSCYYVGDDIIRAVAESCHGLIRLVVSECRFVIDASMMAVARHCRLLEVLYADTTRVTDRGACAIARSCPRLRRLCLPRRVRDAGLRQVASHCLQLEHLGLLRCKLVTDAGIKAVAAGCPRLRRLDALHCIRLGDEGVSVLAGACPGLRRFTVAATKVTGAGVCAVASHCMGLEYRDVSMCGGVTDAIISEVAWSCRHLQHLLMDKCEEVGDAGIRQVARNCPGLRTLSIRETGVGGAGLKAVAASCHELRELNMAQCGTDGNSLVAIAEGCPKLEKLDVRRSGSITEESVLVHARHCTQLRVLWAECETLEEPAVVQFLQEQGKQLRVLDLWRSKITDKTMQLLGEKCWLLRRLDLYYCGGITNKGVDSIGAGCKQLGHFGVAGCNVDLMPMENMDEKTQVDEEPQQSAMALERLLQRYLVGVQWERYLERLQT